MASTAYTSIYRLIYSRTRAYQTRPAVELVSGEEGLSLSRPLRPPFHCNVPGGLYLLWYVVTGTRFPRVPGHRHLVLPKAPGPSGDRGGMPRWGLMAVFAACCTTYNRHCPLVPEQMQSTELPATTDGEWRRRHSLQSQKGGPWTVFLTSCHHILLQGGFLSVVLRSPQTSPNTGVVPGDTGRPRADSSLSDGRAVRGNGHAREGRSHFRRQPASTYAVTEETLGCLLYCAQYNSSQLSRIRPFSLPRIGLSTDLLGNGNDTTACGHPFSQFLRHVAASRPVLD